MAVQHIKIAKESGHGVTGAVVSGTFNMIINSPAFNNVMPSYLSYTKLGLVVKYTVFCTGYSTPAGGGSVEFHYEWGGSAWKVVTYSASYKYQDNIIDQPFDLTFEFVQIGEV